MRRLLKLVSMLVASIAYVWYEAVRLTPRVKKRKAKA